MKTTERHENALRLKVGERMGVFTEQRACGLCEVLRKANRKGKRIRISFDEYEIERTA